MSHKISVGRPSRQLIKKDEVAWFLPSNGGGDWNFMVQSLFIAHYIYIHLITHLEDAEQILKEFYYHKALLLKFYPLGR